MEQVLGLDELYVDCQGEIPVSHKSTVYRVRVSPTGYRLPHVEIYAVAVDDVDADPGLFEALNTINCRLSHGRAHWAGRKVVIGTELVGDSLDSDALGCACFEIGEAAHREGLALSAVYGGVVGRPGYEEEEDE